MRIPPYTTDQATLRAAVVAALDMAAPFVMDRATRIRWEIKNAMQRLAIINRSIREQMAYGDEMCIRHGGANLTDAWHSEQADRRQDLRDARRAWVVVIDELRQHRDAGKLQPITARCVTLSMEG